MAQRHAPRTAGALVRAAPAARQLTHRGAAGNLRLHVARPGEEELAQDAARPTGRYPKGAIGDGEIHHFLLPADGWGAVADAKQAKELAPEQAAALKKWRAEVTKKPSAKQLDRLRALSRRVERLWELTFRRLEISEREISRQIDVWGADIETVDQCRHSRTGRVGIARP